MVGAILFALIFFFWVALALVFAGNPRSLRQRLLGVRGGGPRMPRATLHALVDALFAKVGMEPIATSLLGDDRRWTVRRRETFGEDRVVAFIEDAPPGDVVDQATVVELANAVKGEGASVGLLITPFAIARDGLAGLDAPVELIDGARLRELVTEHLPELLPELEAFRGFGRAPATASARLLEPQPR